MARCRIEKEKNKGIIESNKKLIESNILKKGVQNESSGNWKRRRGYSAL